jgi:hypothetical protein
MVFHLETYNSQANIALSFTATSSGTETEVGLAYSLASQFNTILIQASAAYNGQPVFSDQLPISSFNVTVTDHVVCIWSQANFRIELTSNTTGSSILVGPSPVLVTLQKAKNYAPLLGIEFSDFNENNLTDKQIMVLMELASDQIVKLTNNNIINSTYLKEHIGNMTGTLTLGKGPITSWDVPYIRRPYIILVTAIPLGQAAIAYNVVTRLKLVNYRFTNDLMNLFDPFEMNNEVKMSYRAGFLNIPRIIQEKVVEMSSLMLTDTNIKSLKGGSAAVEFRAPQEVLNAISQELRAYRNSEF